MPRPLLHPPHRFNTPIWDVLTRNYFLFFECFSWISVEKRFGRVMGPTVALVRPTTLSCPAPMPHNAVISNSKLPGTTTTGAGIGAATGAAGAAGAAVSASAAASSAAASSLPTVAVHCTNGTSSTLSVASSGNIPIVDAESVSTKEVVHTSVWRRWRRRCRACRFSCLRPLSLLFIISFKLYRNQPFFSFYIFSIFSFWLLLLVFDFFLLLLHFHVVSHFLFNSLFKDICIISFCMC